MSLWPADIPNRREQLVEGHQRVVPVLACVDGGVPCSQPLQSPATPALDEFLVRSGQRWTSGVRVPQKAVLSQSGVAARQQEESADGLLLAEGSLDEVATAVADGHVVGAVLTPNNLWSDAVDRHVEGSDVVAAGCRDARTDVGASVDLDLSSAEMATRCREGVAGVDTHRWVVEACPESAVNESKEERANVSYHKMNG